MYLIYHTTRKLYLTKPKYNMPMFHEDRDFANEFQFKENAEEILNDNRLFTPEVIKEKHLIKIVEEK